MAALSDVPLLELLDLRHVRAADLDPVLEQEAETWRRELEWDFGPSGDLVRRFVHMQALNGYALVLAGRLIGYCYYVCEEHKGLIGDLYLLDEYRTVETENSLLAGALEALVRTPYIRRIEAQLMLIKSSQWRPQGRFLRRYQRNFMMLDLSLAAGLPVGRAAPRIAIDGWSERRQEEAAHVISGAYEGHVDSQINDQYRSLAGARRFLMNIVQYPGCGSFFQPASYLAFDRTTGGMCGLSLASLVAADVGHITQICVAPGVKGTGVGYELMRRSILSLAAHGCRKTSLTVTASNAEAVRLYERMGFETQRRFDAFVWEGF